ncbi:MAG: inositol monophosphatase family protein [Verrucomicrobiales bacterium]
MPTHLEIATSAARQAGQLLRENYCSDLKVDEMAAYDIKLALDVESQELITGVLLEAFPDHAIFGEEGIAGNQDSPFQWIVDPIDGTVNYFYGIPHFCISIALREGGEIKTGVIYDPMLDELWAVEKGEAPTLNGEVISTSPRTELSEAVVTIGFSKSKESLDAGFERFKDIAPKVRKVRILGSAALAMAYISCGRLDAYIEEQISLWDIAAGLLLVEAAGGQVNMIPNATAPDKESICAFNGKIPLGHLFNS